MMSLKPEYNNKVRLAILLAPAAYMSHATHQVFEIADLANGIELFTHLLGHYEFLPHNYLSTWLAHSLCNEEEDQVAAAICINIGFLILGINEGQLNRTMIPTYLSHLPA